MRAQMTRIFADYNHKPATERDLKTEDIGACFRAVDQRTRLAVR